MEEEEEEEKEEGQRRKGRGVRSRCRPAWEQQAGQGAVSPRNGGAEGACRVDILKYVFVKVFSQTSCNSYLQIGY